MVVYYYRQCASFNVQLSRFEIPMNPESIYSLVYKVVLPNSVGSYNSAIARIGSFGITYYPLSWANPREGSKIFAFSCFNSARDFGKAETLNFEIWRSLAENPKPGNARYFSINSIEDFGMFSSIWRDINDRKPYLEHTPVNTIFCDRLMLLEKIIY
jgi:hypothetical protein